MVPIVADKLNEFKYFFFQKDKKVEKNGALVWS